MLSEESYKDSTCAFLGRTPTCRDRGGACNLVCCGHGALVAATLSLLFNVVEPKSCVYVCYVD
ncbi:hypothetical protein BGY98DRAFT_980212 [Russula aff. rugulosa BPL654]|nr:hypothetical protein BGY98DRAFT_980212 [Russula aff. rugulosa BPL654]